VFYEKHKTFWVDGWQYGRNAKHWERWEPTHWIPLVEKDN
jgi:hypothetical protein